MAKKLTPFNKFIAILSHLYALIALIIFTLIGFDFIQEDRANLLTAFLLLFSPLFLLFFFILLYDIWQKRLLNRFPIWCMLLCGGIGIFGLTSWIRLFLFFSGFPSLGST